MSTEPTARAMLGGLLGGKELSGAANVSVDDDAVVLAGDRERVVIPFATLHGMRLLGDSLELFHESGDVVLLEGSSDMAAVATQLSRRLCSLPEMMRSLRAFGSRKATPREEHDRFFAILLEARRAAEGAPNVVALRAAFDAGELRGAFTKRLKEFAAERYPKHPPERRALEAELLESVEPLMASVTTLEQAQDALGASDDAERFVRWRSWSSALGRVFERADECWFSVSAILVDGRRSPRGFLSRFRRRSA